LYKSKFDCLSANPFVPPLTRFVTASTTSLVSPLSQIDHKLLLLKKKAAEARGYLVAIKSGLATQSSPIKSENAL